MIHIDSTIVWVGNQADQRFGDGSRRGRLLFFCVKTNSNGCIVFFSIWLAPASFG
jgi:hypothetical protein